MEFHRDVNLLGSVIGSKVLHWELMRESHFNAITYTDT